MCGDLVSNHGTTGRASIERAEARPSYPILSFAWSHVGAGGAGANQPNPTDSLSFACTSASQPTALLLLLLLPIPPPSLPTSHPLTPLPPSACHPLLPTAVLFLLLLLLPLLLLLLLIHLLLLVLLPPSFGPQTTPRYNLLNQCRHTYTHSELRPVCRPPLRCPPCDPLLPICPSAVPQPRAIPKNLNVFYHSGNGTTAFKCQGFRLVWESRVHGHPSIVDGIRFQVTCWYFRD